MGAGLDHAYVSDEELGAYIQGFTTQTERAGDLIGAVNTASREIDGWCGTRFWADPHGNDDEPTTRRFYAYSEERDGWCRSVVDIADAFDVVSIATDDDDDGTAETEWDAADFLELPIDGMVDGLEGFPVRRLEALTGLFPEHTRRPGVHATAYWGWLTVPKPVRQSCLRVAHWVFHAPNAPMGVQGFNEFGAVRMPRDEFQFVATALGPYCRPGGQALPAIA